MINGFEWSWDITSSILLHTDSAIFDRKIEAIGVTITIIRLFRSCDIQRGWQVTPPRSMTRFRLLIDNSAALDNRRC